jgi:hypothetical protein
MAGLGIGIDGPQRRRMVVSARQLASVSTHNRPFVPVSSLLKRIIRSSECLDHLCGLPPRPDGGDGDIAASGLRDLVRR